MSRYTPTQGRYLKFIHKYRKRNGYSPAESEIGTAMCVSPPSVNQMVKMLEKRGLISREPGTARSIKLLLSAEELQELTGEKPKAATAGKKKATKRATTKAASRKSASGRTRTLSTTKTSPKSQTKPVNLYVLAVYLTSGPTEGKFVNKEISRVIEIRGDQTLHDLHEAIFSAYDRFEEHLYQFEFGKRPFDPKGDRYGLPIMCDSPNDKDATTTTLDDLNLAVHRTFGYCFDFGDEWYHQISVEKIEQAIPTVRYPRRTRRVGKSPPQYAYAD